MRKLFEINKDIERILDEDAVLKIGDGQAVDTETGEVFSLAERLNALQIEKAEKIKSVAFYADDLLIKAKALKEREEEIKALRKSIDKQIENLHEYILYAINNETYEGEDVTIKVRKSTRTEILCEELLPEEFIKTETVIKRTPDKTAIKNAIKNGQTVEGAELVTAYSINII